MVNFQVGDINVQTLISYTSFNDECGESPDRLVAFKRWLWSIVEKMTPLEKQDLVFFWTGKKIPFPLPFSCNDCQFKAVRNNEV